MSDLPLPVRAQSQAPNGAPMNVNMNSQANPAVSRKMLQTQAAEQIEAAILQTTTSPAERALMVHNIKAAYIKARFGIDMKGAA